MADLSLSLLGAFEATHHSQPLTGFRTHKVRALLVYLAVHAERAHGRETLATLLWPDQPDEAARTYLRQALVNLRAVLDEAATEVPVLLITRDTVQLNPACTPDVDVATFRALLAACAWHPHRSVVSCTACARRLEQAVALYGGSFLGQFYLRESTAFEEWAALTREALHQEAVAALAHLALYHERRGTYTAVERLARRQLQLDPWREEAHQQLMRALALSDRRSAALEQYKRCQTILQADLGVEPSTETEELYRQIRAERLVPEAVVGRAIGLPHPTTSFVGREADRAALVEQLTTRSCRLITLVGAPGIGKTRLSQEVAAELVGDFEDGVVFVPLAALRDPTLVVRTITAALRVAIVGEEPLLETLKRAVQARHLLLVLDNFEQVVDAAEHIAELLAVAPNLAVLVTSRAVLHLAGERVYSVPPLALPEPEQHLEVAALSKYEAVVLFISRVQAVKPDYQLTTANAPAIAEICARLDGLPLAIELAAARSRLFGPHALLARLGNRLPFLTGGARDLLQRHQTISNTIAWSYDLLSAGQRRLFQRLAVFAGGCTLEAAEAVCSVDGDLDVDVQEGLTALVDQSLVRSVEDCDGEPRFTMLETIHDYALERLQESGDLEVLRRQHGVYVLALVEMAEPKLHTSELPYWYRRLHQEFDNLRAALSWSRQAQDGMDLHLRLASGLWLFWWSPPDGPTQEGRAWLEGVVEQTVPVPPALRARVLRALAVLLHNMGETVRAGELFEDSLALYRMVNDQAGVAWGLLLLGRNVHLRDNRQRAVRLEDESLQRMQKLADLRGIAMAQVSLGTIWLDEGDMARAVVHLRAALTCYETLHFDGYVPWVKMHLGEVAQHQGDLGRAATIYEESLTAFRAHDDHHGVGYALWCLGRLEQGMGDVEAARRLREGLMVERGLGKNLSGWLEALASVAAGKGQVMKAVRLLGAAAAERQVHGEPSTLPTSTDCEQEVTTRVHLTQFAWDAAWAEGRAMTPEQAIAYALNEVPDA